AVGRADAPAPEPVGAPGGHAEEDAGEDGRRLALVEPDVGVAEPEPVEDEEPDNRGERSRDRRGAGEGAAGAPLGGEDPGEVARERPPPGGGAPAGGGGRRGGA